MPGGTVGREAAGVADVVVAAAVSPADVVADEVSQEQILGMLGQLLSMGLSASRGVVVVAHDKVEQTVHGQNVAILVAVVRAAD